MTITQMRYMAEVSRHGNITKASQSLHVSQPSVSKAIQELENELGVNLFHRVKNRLLITQEGEYFVRCAEDILGQLDKLAAEMKDIGRKHNIISIGVPPMIGAFIFPDVFDLFKKENPAVLLEIVEHGSLRILEMVLSEELDVALAITDKDGDPRINAIEVKKTELCFCVDKKHPLAGAGGISFADMQDEQVILFQGGYYQNAVIRGRFAAFGIEPNIVLLSSQLYTVRQMIKRGRAGAFLFREMAALDPELAPLRLKEPIEINISLIWKKERHIYSDTARLIEVVKRSFPKDQSS